jgi:hypothetical protein
MLIMFLSGRLCEVLVVSTVAPQTQTWCVEEFQKWQWLDQMKTSAHFCHMILPAQFFSPHNKTTMNEYLRNAMSSMGAERKTSVSSIHQLEHE